MFLRAGDGIRAVERCRGIGEVYKRLIQKLKVKLSKLKSRALLILDLGLIFIFL